MLNLGKLNLGIIDENMSSYFQKTHVLTIDAIMVMLTQKSGYYKRVELASIVNEIEAILKNTE